MWYLIGNIINLLIFAGFAALCIVRRKTRHIDFLLFAALSVCFAVEVCREVHRAFGVTLAVSDVRREYLDYLRILMGMGYRQLISYVETFYQ